LINYIPYELNATDNYTNEQIEFSYEIIEKWSNFIKYGQPKSTKSENQWIPFGNTSNGLIMHLKMNRSEMKQFEIPSSVRFWMYNCLNNTVSHSNNPASIDEISLTVFVCASLFVAFISYDILV
jgi:hypothetical protein